MYKQMKSAKRGVNKVQSTFKNQAVPVMWRRRGGEAASWRVRDALKTRPQRAHSSATATARATAIATVTI